MNLLQWAVFINFTLSEWIPFQVLIVILSIVVVIVSSILRLLLFGNLCGLMGLQFLGSLNQFRLF